VIHSLAGGVCEDRCGSPRRQHRFQFDLRPSRPETERALFMDADRFDSLARSLVVAGTRRQVVVALAASLGLLGLAKPDDVAAAKSGRCKPQCAECQHCKRGHCRKTRHHKKRCKKGRCQPVSEGTFCTGGSCCGGRCVNTRTNEANCGGCGVACPAGLSCCRGICTNRATDPANCGRCGTVCPPTAPVCSTGICGP
jgi:hypothetical protein